MTQNDTKTDNGPPKARTKRMGRFASLVWTVPVAATLLAGYLVYQRVREVGDEITIRFKDATGIMPGQTMLRHRGVEIGDVTDVELDDGLQTAVVKVRLKHFGAAVAREGSLFWVVRPQLDMGSLSGLGTIISGPYIAVEPGDGPEAMEFEGLGSSPLVRDPDGLKVVLLAKHAKSLQAGVPIYYRGVEVGTVRSVRLSTNANTVRIAATVRQRFAPLVREDSKFWNVAGVDISMGLFRGAEVDVESLKSLMVGGIAFATPENEGSRAVKDGHVFELAQKEDEDWLGWQPAIHIPTDASEEEPVPTADQPSERIRQP